MNSVHQFGGNWTEDKLNRVRDYLCAYMKIFTRNPRASWFKTVYVDAFAGTGYRTDSEKDKNIVGLLLDDNDAVSYKKGSAVVALDTNPSFDEYVFVEFNGNYAKELEKLRSRYPEKAHKIRVAQQEANTFLQSWCGETNWYNTRAVVFLDPYGMQVEWKTIEAMANTRGIDLWILFPLGQAVMRLLKRNSIPDGAWADRLTAFFGTDEWKDAFYGLNPQSNIFGDENFEKTADFKSIETFFITRLKKIFAGVASNPRPLCNTKNIPLFLLCFAAANDKGAKPAVTIAQHILRD